MFDKSLLLDNNLAVSKLTPLSIKSFTISALPGVKLNELINEPVAPFSSRLVAVPKLIEPFVTAKLALEMSPTADPPFSKSLIVDSAKGVFDNVVNSDAVTPEPIKSLTCDPV